MRTFPKVVVLAAALGLAAGPASALSEAEAKTLIENAYKVKVLRVAKDEEGGRAVYRLRVMNPAADFNAAMQVSVMTLDAESGQLLPIYRHRASGIDDNASPMMRPNRQGEEALSIRSVWR
jgi:hypothetical protein